jgi:hypothetical protein
MENLSLFGIVCSVSRRRIALNGIGMHIKANKIPERKICAFFNPAPLLDR